MCKIRIIDEPPAAEIGLARTPGFNKSPQGKYVVDLLRLAAQVTAVFEGKTECKIESDQETLCRIQLVDQPLRNFLPGPSFRLRAIALALRPFSSTSNQLWGHPAGPADRNGNPVVPP